MVKSYTENELNRILDGNVKAVCQEVKDKIAQLILERINDVAPNGVNYTDEYMEALENLCNELGYSINKEFTVTVTVE